MKLGRPFIWLGIIVLLIVGYSFITFQIMKPRCLAVLNEKEDSIIISSTATEPQIQQFAIAAGKIEGVIRAFIRPAAADSNRRRVEIYHSPSADPANILLRAKEEAKKVGIEIVLYGRSDFNDYGDIIEILEKRSALNPGWMIWEVLYLPIMLLPDEPTLLAPPLRMFTLCARGEV